MLRVLAILLCCIFPAVARAAETDPVRILVFPLNASAAGRLPAWMGECVAQSLSSQLDGDGVHVISRDERVELLERNDLPPGAELSRGSMIKMGQRASADLVVLGQYLGTEQNIKLSAWVLDLHRLKLSAEIAATGPIAALPQMENDLAWMILTRNVPGKSIAREKFRAQARKVSNAAYALFIQSLNASSEGEQIRLLEKALQSQEDFPAAHFQLGQIYYKNREYAKAIQPLTQGSKAQRTHMQSEFMIGTCHLQSNQLAPAMQIFSQMLHFIRRPEILNNLAIAQMRSGDLASALHALLEAKSLAPADSTISMNLAVVRYQMNNAPAALESLEDALQAHPDNGMLQFIWGILLQKQGDSGKSAQAMAGAKRSGVAVDALLSEKPETWARIMPAWSGR